MISARMPNFVLSMILTTMFSYSLPLIAAPSLTQQATIDEAQKIVTTTDTKALSSSLVRIKKQLADISVDKNSESRKLLEAISSLNAQVTNIEAELKQLKSWGPQEIEQKVDYLYEERNFFSYADFAAIAITCVSVLITGVGIAIALLSFFGIRNIRKTTKKSTEDLATQIANDTAKNAIEPAVEKQLTKLIDEGRINKHLEEVVDSFILRRDPSLKADSNKDAIDWEELDWEEHPELEIPDNSNLQTAN